MAEMIKKEKVTVQNSKDYIGESLSFEGIEAFNLLRANLTFSFTDEKKCHVIGVTSSIEATGKSLITCNLAYYLAKTGKKVLLIDGDLRLSTIAKKLKLNVKPGLSNLLISSDGYKTVVQQYNNILDVITAGDIPPNPSELLNSERFGALVKEMQTDYDYVLFDLPPVNIVSDAVVIAKNIDGFILVIRKDHDEKQLVKEMIRKMDLANAKILGMVFNSSKLEETNKKGKNLHEKKCGGK